MARDTAWQRARAGLLALAGRRRAPAALASYDLFLCNSGFTQEHIARRLGVEAVVLSPPVDPPPPPVPAPERRRRILSVGRFFHGAHDKRQDVLIRAFAELRTLLEDPEGWELHLAGGADERASTRRRLDDLHSLARGLPVHFHVNASAAELGELYATSELYWHAAGYRVRADRHPERAEHFGIATAEAMAHGAVPLVVPVGGQAELVSDGVNGRHWLTTPELVQRAQELIEDPPAVEVLRKAARADARRYGKDRFLAEVRRLVLAPGS
jgi:glycosyltransferase involved in cell wall biosynthesis